MTVKTKNITKNITVTNPEIIDLLQTYREQMGKELGFEVTITQALTRLLKEAIQ